MRPWLIRASSQKRGQRSYSLPTATRGRVTHALARVVAGIAPPCAWGSLHGTRHGRDAWHMAQLGGSHVTMHGTLLLSYELIADEEWMLRPVQRACCGSAGDPFCNDQHQRWLVACAAFASCFHVTALLHNRRS
jgi:hypothetical protein